MQQLYLTGVYAGKMADQLFHALNVRPLGLQLLPVMVGEGVRGEAVQLLLPPAEPMYNGVPCRIRLSKEKSVTVPAALEKVVAPGLMAALRVHHTPMLLSGLSADLLDCEAFREAVRLCLVSDRAVVVVADESAVPVLQAMTPTEEQLWFAVPEDAAGQSALLEALIPEAALRF